jgi:hypothetical protein
MSAINCILAYLVSFLNLLQGVQSCTNNHLLLGADCAEDHPLMMSYTKRLTKEMEEMEATHLKTERGHEVSFKFECSFIATFTYIVVSLSIQV